MAYRLYLIKEEAEMANEDKKDFNAMLHDNKDMPKIQTITDQKVLKNMVEVKCILLRPLTMTG